MAQSSENLPPVRFDDDAWEALAATTNANLCFQCGTCTAACPLAETTPLRVRQLVREAQFGETDAFLWKCMTCAECNASCPRGVDIVSLIRGLRGRQWHTRDVPKGLPTLLWGMYSDGNTFHLPPKDRASWLQDVKVPGKGSTLLYVGCAASYDPRAQRIARSVAALLNLAGVEYQVMGNEEVCCGEAARSVGHDALFQDLQQRNTESFRKRGVERVIAISPHSFDALKAGQAANGGPQVVHYTQAIEELLDSGKLGKDSAKGTVTYHDPCYLGRHNGVYESPRRLLELSGLKVVEMGNSRAQALCCGGGGGRMWMETAPVERPGSRRVHEAAGTGAELLATACPYCISVFESERGSETIPVTDVAELIARRAKA
ncbi:MAG: (Fe-S)-binding protein [Thermoplasmata archaeon]